MFSKQICLWHTFYMIYLRESHANDLTLSYIIYLKDILNPKAQFKTFIELRHRQFYIIFVIGFNFYSRLLKTLFTIAATSLKKVLDVESSWMGHIYFSLLYFIQTNSDSKSYSKFSSIIDVLKSKSIFK